MGCRAYRAEGMISYAAFRAGVQDAIDHVRAEHADADVLIVSSGGPISTAVGLVLGYDAGDHHRSQHAHAQQCSDRIRSHTEAARAHHHNAATSRSARVPVVDHSRMSAGRAATSADMYRCG